jgi:signal peptidase I
MPAQGEAAIRPCAIAVFKKPSEPGEPEVSYIKRIVAVAGDRVAYVAGQLRLNGKIVPREKIRVEGDATIYRETLPSGCSYLIQEFDYHGPLGDVAETVVPSGHFYALGDNRDDSLDSRTSHVGQVPAENLVGRAAIIFFSTDGTASWWEVWKWPFAIRYGRLFDLVK